MSNGWSGLGGVPVEIEDGRNGELFVTECWTSSSSGAELALGDPNGHCSCRIYISDEAALKLAALLLTALLPAEETGDAAKVVTDEEIDF